MTTENSKHYHYMKIVIKKVLRHGCISKQFSEEGGHSKISVSILDNFQTLFIFLLNKMFSYFLAKQIVVCFVVLVATKNQMRRGGIGK